MVVGPLEAVHAEVVAQQAVARRLVLGVGRAEHQDRAVDQEDKLSAGPQDPRRLGDPAVGIAPDAGAVLRDGKVESRLVGPQCWSTAASATARVSEMETRLSTPVKARSRLGKLSRGATIRMACSGCCSACSAP